MHIQGICLLWWVIWTQSQIFEQKQVEVYWDSSNGPTDHPKSRCLGQGSIPNRIPQSAVGSPMFLSIRFVCWYLYDVSIYLLDLSYFTVPHLILSCLICPSTFIYLLLCMQWKISIIYLTAQYTTYISVTRALLQIYSPQLLNLSLVVVSMIQHMSNPT